MVGVVLLVKEVSLSGWLDDGGKLRFEGEPCGVVVSLEAFAGLCVSVGASLGVLFGLKNPLSVFCPGAEGVDAWVTDDFERLSVTGGAGGSLFSDLLRVIPWVSLFSSVTWTDGVLFPSDAVGDSFSCTETVRSSAVEAVFDFCDGLRVNMSLMFLLLSNSGINRPDVGKRHLVEYSCWRSPSRNIPSGFIISSMLTGPLSSCTESLNVA